MAFPSTTRLVAYGRVDRVLLNTAFVELSAFPHGALLVGIPSAAQHDWRPLTSSASRARFAGRRTWLGWRGPRVGERRLGRG